MSTVNNIDETPLHLTKRASGVRTTTQFAESELASREFWCRDCCSRVTQTSDGKHEYGHDPACEHSIRRKDSHKLQWRGEKQ